MTMETVFDIVLILLLLGIAVWSIAARGAFSAIIIFMVYGLLLSLAWTRLAAIDVGLTEAAIGSGVTGMLLLNAVARLRPAPGVTLPAPWQRVAAGMLAMLVSAGLAALVLFFPGDAVTLAPLAVANLDASGLGNPVAGVLFVYRAIDTLLEKVVLLLGLLGVWSLASDKSWGGAAGLWVSPRPDGTLVLLAKALPPFGILVAIYMCWVGASEPGGAFQGSAILAAMWILVMIARLRDVPAIGSSTVRRIAAVGPAIFLAIGIAGIFVAGAFLAYPAAYAKPLIVVIEVGLTLSIGVTLALLASGAPDKVLRS